MFKTSKTFLVIKYFCFRGYHLKQLLFEIMFLINLFLYQYHKFLFGKKAFATNSFCPGSISHSCYQYQHQYFDNLSFSICQKHPWFENFYLEKKVAFVRYKTWLLKKEAFATNSFWRGSIFHSCNQCRAGTIDELHLFPSSSDSQWPA